MDVTADPIGDLERGAREQRERATDQAFRRRAAELDGHRRELAERKARLSAELAQARLLADAELTAGLRRLRDDGRTALAHSDPRYPELLAGAAAELGGRFRQRSGELVAAAAARTLAGLDTVAPEPAVDDWAPPPISPPPGRSRWSAEERVFVLGTVPVAAGLVRVSWVGGPPAPLLAGLAVSAGLGAACWMVRIRRVGAERNRLDRWTTEVLADTRTGLANEFADRLVRAAAQVQAVLADLSGRVDRQVAEHDRAVRSALSRRRERAQARLEQASLERAR